MGLYSDKMMEQIRNIGQPRVTTQEAEQSGEGPDIGSLMEMLYYLGLFDQKPGGGGMPAGLPDFSLASPAGAPEGAPPFDPRNFNLSPFGQGGGGGGETTGMTSMPDLSALGLGGGMVPPPTEGLGGAGIGTPSPSGDPMADVMSMIQGLLPPGGETPSPMGALAPPAPPAPPATPAVGSTIAGLPPEFLNTGITNMSDLLRLIKAFSG